MKLLVAIGVCLFTLLGVTFLLTLSPGKPAPVASAPVLQPLDDKLGRPFVMYVDGEVSPAFRDALLALDTSVGALADQPEVRTLLDLDVYVMLRGAWEDYRAIKDHDLGALIRQQAQNKGADTGFAWFEAALNAEGGTARDVLVILASRAGLSGLSDFCLALTVYDLARFSGNGPAFVEATDGDGSHWKDCQAQGWTQVADMASGRG
ncbi:hypothetical protein ACERZ8_14085 [Tateyamaria armeniaca]|uniref:Uncharacterized protein n=1 Tax=Tateyamaria armeniaca TaxID=2518930 RepID=A0ABW8UZ41_9RHOB